VVEWYACSEFRVFGVGVFDRLLRFDSNCNVAPPKPQPATLIRHAPPPPPPNRQQDVIAPALSTHLAEVAASLSPQGRLQLLFALPGLALQPGGC